MNVAALSVVVAAWQSKKVTCFALSGVYIQQGTMPHGEVLLQVLLASSSF